MRYDARVLSGIHFRIADTQGAVLGKRSPGTYASTTSSR
jgi:hypothetical protein